MTASELYAIYAPAFEAAGERPSRNTRVGNAYLMFDVIDGGAAWSWHNPSEGIVDVQDAANACRCWAEDWIAHSGVGYVLRVPPCDHDGVDMVCVVKATERGVGTALDAPCVGETIHHALSAAVVAVARAKWGNLC